MSKNPAFLFYPGDWIQDTRSLSLASKGAWIDLLCAMWRSQTRGELTLPIIGYARMIGATADQAKAVIDELISMQICNSVTDGNGNVTLTNRRMKREEKERISTRYRVQKHRNAEEKRDGNGNVTVPLSVSVSVSVPKDKNKDITPPPLKSPHGEFQNILLNDEEHKRLIEKHGEDWVTKKIESFSNSLKSQPRKYSKYKDHYATLNNWISKDKEGKDPKFL